MSAESDDVLNNNNLNNYVTNLLFKIATLSDTTKSL